MKTISNFKIVLYISIIAFILRLISVYIFADIDNPEMWEFGIIARNLLSGEGYQYPAITINVPSAYMPPGLPYIYFVFFKLFGDNQTGYLVILIFNSVLSAVSIVLIYQLSKKLYSETNGMLSALYICFSPVIVFSTINFNSIIIYQILLCLVYIYYLEITDKSENKGHNNKSNNYKKVIILGIITGIFLYFRAEMLVLLFFISVLLLTKKMVSQAFLLMIIPSLIILPWTIRNYYTFDKVIPITTSMGYNFYSGHGDDESTIAYKQRIMNLKEDSTFEIEKSKVSTEMALKYIKEHPWKDLYELLKRIYSLWITDTYRESAKHPLYLITWLPTLILFIIGLYKSYSKPEIKNKLSFLFIYLIFSTILVIVFFNVPRYQIQMSFVMIPIAMFGLQSLINSIKNIRVKQ